MTPWESMTDGSTTAHHDRILFVDIDGVLNNSECLLRGSGTNAPANPDSIAALNRITELTGAKIVVSSAWRLIGGIEFLRSKFHEWGVHANILDHTPCLTRTVERPSGPLEMKEPRSLEIKSWLSSYKRPVYSYVILDDESSDLHGLLDRLVQTDRTKGLTFEQADDAVQLFTIWWRGTDSDYWLEHASDA